MGHQISYMRGSRFPSPSNVRSSHQAMMQKVAGEQTGQTENLDRGSKPLPLAGSFYTYDVSGLACGI
jgi:hypothetical protein